jgi:hypothetical protein
MKVSTILGWSYTVVLCVAYSLLLSIYGLYCFSEIQVENLLSRILLLSGISAVLLLTVVITLSRWFRKYGVDSNGRYRLVCMILLTIPFGWMLTDVKPIENDYTINDVVSNDPEVLKSYETFLLLVSREKGVKVDADKIYSASTKIASPDCTNIVACSADILQAWDSIAEVRAVIEKLDSYPGLTDLIPQTHLDDKTPVQNFKTLRSISSLYAAYARVKIAEGNTEEAAREIAKFYRVTRKVLPHSLRLIDKAIWSRMAVMQLEAASTILRDPKCTPETLKLLQTAFPPLSPEDISFRRPIIAEYLFLKAHCEAYKSIVDIVWVDPKPQPFFHKITSTLKYGLTFKLNLTIKGLRKDCDCFLRAAALKPPFIKNEEFNMDVILKKRPELWNMGGWLLIRYSAPDYWHFTENSRKAKVLSDLLAIEISERLHTPLLMNDFYIDAPYSRDIKVVHQ